MVGPSRAAGFGTLSRCAHYKPREGFRRILERAAVDHDRLKREAVRVLENEGVLTRGPGKLIYGVNGEEPGISVKLGGNGQGILNGKLDILIIDDKGAKEAVVVEVKTSKSKYSSIEASHVEQLRDYLTTLAVLLSHREKLEVEGVERGGLRLVLDGRRVGAPNSSVVVSLSDIGDPGRLYNAVKRVKKLKGVLVKISGVGGGMLLYTILQLKPLDLKKDKVSVEEEFARLVEDYLELEKIKARLPRVVGPWCYTCKWSSYGEGKEAGCPVFKVGGGAP